MAKKSIEDVAAVFELLGLSVPDRARLERIAADNRSVGQVRDDLLRWMARDQGLSIEQVLANVVRQYFVNAGLEIGTSDESEADRLARIAAEIWSGQRTLHEVSSTIADLASGGGSGGGDGDGITDVPPVTIGGSTIPAGGRLVRVDNPQGSDEPHLYYIIYEWRGVQFAYEVGGPARFKELFGSTDNFDGFTRISQAAFDESNFVQVGLIDQELGATESLGSRIERDIRALGMEDLPAWLANSPDALALVGQATAQEWSSGRLWTELSATGAFQQRFGAVWAKYKTDNVTIADAVAQIVADENALSAALRPWAAEGVSTETIHAYLNNGWTGSAAAQVLEAAEDLARRPDTLDFVNQVLSASGFQPLDEVSYINALHGHGPQEAIEAVNTAQAARALIESGIDLADDDVDLIMDLVDTSDRLLTPESWRSLAQELSFNIMRNTRELSAGKLGLGEDDLVAAAFGRESPTGKSTGEVLGLLARFERDRRGEAEGHDAMSGFVDDRGRLRVPGLAGL